MAVDRNQVVRMRLFIRLNRDLTRAFREVFQEILNLYSISGRVFPSYAAIARRAMCCERTVGRAIKRFEALGILSWLRRRRRPNVYTIAFSAAGVHATAACQANVSRAERRVPALPVAVRAPDDVLPAGGVRSAAWVEAIIREKRAAT